MTPPLCTRICPRSSKPHPRAPSPDPRSKSGPVFVASGGVIMRQLWENGVLGVFQPTAKSFFLPHELTCPNFGQRGE